MAKQQVEFDVVIVGAGGSGLAAAVTLAQGGCSVLVLEKCSAAGGTTALAVGSLTASGTRQQRFASIEDDVSDHLEDVAKFATPEIEAHNNPALRRLLLTQSADTLEWLESLGLEFKGPFPEPPNRVPRLHQIHGDAQQTIKALLQALSDAGGQCWLNTRVRELLVEDNRVSGVVCETRKRAIRVRARQAVVLAAGDYSSAADLIQREKGDRFAHVEGINPNATGDGHRLAESVDAQLVNMQITYGPELRFVVSTSPHVPNWLPAHKVLTKVVTGVENAIPKRITRLFRSKKKITWQHPQDQLFRDGAILINKEGRRFVNELNPAKRDLAVSEQEQKIAYILLDGRLVQQYSAWPHFVSTAPDIAYAYIQDYQRLRPDITLTAMSLDYVAARLGFSLENLNATLDQFNRYSSGQAQDEWGRTGDGERLDRGPWVVLGPVKSYFTTTEGGVAVNLRQQALDRQQQPIPGLYAVGQNGLGGVVLWGHGLHLAWAFSSGRRAAQAILEDAVLDKTPSQEPTEPSARSDAS